MMTTTTTVVMVVMMMMIFFILFLFLIDLFFLLFPLLLFLFSSSSSSSGFLPLRRVFLLLLLFDVVGRWCRFLREFLLDDSFLFFLAFSPFLLSLFLHLHAVDAENFQFVGSFLRSLRTFFLLLLPC